MTGSLWKGGSSAQSLGLVGCCCLPLTTLNESQPGKSRRGRRTTHSLSMEDSELLSGMFAAEFDCAVGGGNVNGGRSATLGHKRQRVRS